jgi:hypothetical protein
MEMTLIACQWTLASSISISRMLETGDIIGKVDLLSTTGGYSDVHMLDLLPTIHKIPGFRHHNNCSAMCLILINLKVMYI